MSAQPRPRLRDAEEALNEAVSNALDKARMREKALTLAVNHFSKPNRFTTNQAKIVELAEAFYDFLVAAK